MVLNFTQAEWDALYSAAILQDTEWEQNGLSYAGSVSHRRSALHRAMRKAGQLAPDGSFRWASAEQIGPL